METAYSGAVHWPLAGNVPGNAGEQLPPDVTRSSLQMIIVRSPSLALGLVGLPPRVPIVAQLRQAVRVAEDLSRHGLFEQIPFERG
jgi:hypothetical protein